MFICMLIILIISYALNFNKARATFTGKEVLGYSIAFPILDVISWFVVSLLFKAV